MRRRHRARFPILFDEIGLTSPLARACLSLLRAITFVTSGARKSYTFHAPAHAAYAIRGRPNTRVTIRQIDHKRANREFMSS
jgi:hypothetical protein